MMNATKTGQYGTDVSSSVVVALRPLFPACAGSHYATTPSALKG